MGIEAAVFAEQTLRRFLRSPPLIVSALAFPLVMLLAQVAAFGGIVGSAGQGDYIDHFGPLVMLTTASFAAAGSATSFHADLKSGLIDRIRIMQVSPGALLAGRVCGDVLRILVVAIVVAAVAYPLGFRFSQGVAAALAFFAVVVLFGAMVTWVALFTALYSTSLDRIDSLLGNPTLVLYFFSTGFVPLSAFPDLLQPFVRANPMSVVDEALIELSNGGSSGATVIEALAWTLGASLVLASVAVRRYRRLSR